MSKPLSTKPYMVRAIHEWCVDSGFTPYLLVRVNAQTRVPIAYVKNGEIVLNVGYAATKAFQVDADAITFSARFNGVPFEVYVPMRAVKGIYARENGQGMFFEDEPEPESEGYDSEDKIQSAVDELQHEAKSQAPKKPKLRIVK